MSNPSHITRSKSQQGSTDTSGGDSMEGIASIVPSNTYNFVNNQPPIAKPAEEGFETVKSNTKEREMRIKKKQIQQEYKKNRLPQNQKNHQQQQQVFRLIPPVDDFIQYKGPSLYNLNSNKNMKKGGNGLPPKQADHQNLGKIPIVINPQQVYIEEQPQIISNDQPLIYPTIRRINKMCNKIKVHLC